ncbi:MAG: lysylphosphatidylglycerol synthase transmembrane domain-containing protein [Marinobacter sp.]|nr:lysylphosphatidylglycerol synthase transmembrane domain-containing protein [Marinobacter sp.]
MTDKTPPTRGRQPVVRWLVSLGLIALIAAWVDWQQVVAQLGQVSPVAVVAALCVTVLQVVASAWRWQYTAGRLGLLLPIRAAVREYYLATFLNQVLPGGILGDVGRAWRHGRASQATIASANAVLIERLSGQIMLTLITLALMILFWPFGSATASVPRQNGTVEPWVWLVVCAAMILVLWAGVRLRHTLRHALRRYLGQLRDDLRDTLLSWPAWAVQGLSSALVVGSYLLVFLLLATGLDMVAAGDVRGVSWMTLLPLMAGLLAAMAWPVTVAGWGVREGAAALLWSAAGLPPEQGVALSVAYGLLVLASSLPGAVLLVAGLVRKPPHA